MIGGLRALVSRSIMRGGEYFFGDSPPDLVTDVDSRIRS